MSSEREVALFMAQILDQTERPQDMVEAMKKVISLNPALEPDERNLLSVAYKNVVSSRRSALRMVGAVIEHEESRQLEQRVKLLKEYREKLLQELQNYCNEVIELVDKSLLPAAVEAEAKVFYLKLKADYYRYISENLPEDKKSEPASQAKKCYEQALEIARAEIQPARPTHLGLILNYSVFMYEIDGSKQEAIDLAQKTYNECSAVVEMNSDGAYGEATMILQLLRDNVALWTDSEHQDE